jgi:hypothetical protein
MVLTIPGRLLVKVVERQAYSALVPRFASGRGDSICATTALMR